MNDMTMQTQGLEAGSKLSDDERQPCEVWTRVMGYHRPVASFNIGKKGEHRERRFFREQGPGKTPDPARASVAQAGSRDRKRSTTVPVMG